MTHEEIVTMHVAQVVRSYRDLPLILYHFQTKERDEPRPRDAHSSARVGGSASRRIVRHGRVAAARCVAPVRRVVGAPPRDTSLSARAA